MEQYKGECIGGCINGNVVASSTPYLTVGRFLDDIGLVVQTMDEYEWSFTLKAWLFVAMRKSIGTNEYEHRTI